MSVFPHFVFYSCYGLQIVIFQHLSSLNHKLTEGLKSTVVQEQERIARSQNHEQQKLPVEAVPATIFWRLLMLCLGAKWLLREYASWQQRPKLLTPWKPILQTAECSNDSAHALS